ncbi:dipeptide/oligopeptide/nickel ABC transporter permease/ATP-binding protein [Pseudarthrobacter sp. fls2-241-R2A-127]|uniref:dipeptide/oligopeptide/nickel ABC transporter permease/ATP-binding protein n=1 Tax=Pseudarthrobacter sp. fls2-241-R2A-127 TaxID=3040303 RepID=UPI002556F14D|nr:dipeptide/oligopeptide/nickel ABC transporter permease/ATP-binding protein [Pseudarthrobacter sp. fls2-241-R2A-127]
MSVEQLTADPDLEASARTPLWKRLAGDPQAVITGAILTVIVLVGFLGPFFWTHDPNAADLNYANALPGDPNRPLGGDQNGRDILARLLASTQTSIIAGLIGVIVALLVGVTAGLVGGYLGSKTSAVTEWLFNLVMTFPGILLLILLMPVTGGDYRVTMVIYGVLLSPAIFRIVRGLVIATKGELFVDAARVSGLTDTRILARHILAVIRGPIIVASAFLVGTAIGVQAGLAFLGVGSSAVPSFGSMVSEGFTNLYLRPMQFLWPSITLGLITACLILFGNALRDALEGGQKNVGGRKSRRPASSARPLEPIPSEENALLVVRDLQIGYPASDGTVRPVVKGVNFTLNKGEILGLVGESGSGKSQTAFSILKLLPAEAVILGGSVWFDGINLLEASERDMQKIRGRRIGYIPQEPMSNLDPSYRVGAQLVKSVRATTGVDRKEAKARVMELLERVGIANPERVYRSYPFQISGGMAQRVLIAGAVASRPALLIADEPTTALDVTVQAEILDLLRDLQKDLDLAIILVTHNFGVVADICERIAVMKDGRIVETGEAVDVFDNPASAYTKSLLAAILDESTVRADRPAALAQKQE